MISISSNLLTRNKEEQDLNTQNINTGKGTLKHEGDLFRIMKGLGNAVRTGI